jgi:hypothetical protein
MCFDKAHLMGYDIVLRNEGWASCIAHNVGLVGKFCEEYIRARAALWEKLTDTITVGKLEIGVWIWAQK